MVIPVLLACCRNKHGTVAAIVIPVKELSCAYSVLLHVL